MSGIKHDQDKDPWELLPWAAVKEVVKVLAFGASKYGTYNWMGGMAWSRLFAATQRHLVSWWEGEEVDSETGYSHLAHAVCCLLFLITYRLKGIGSDDRKV